MSELSKHIERCNSYDLTHFRQFVIAGKKVGHVRENFLPHLMDFKDVFDIAPASVTFGDGLKNCEERTEALEEIIDDLIGHAVLPDRQGEYYGIAQAWGDDWLAHLDRRMVAVFGIISYGVHVNGFVRDGKEIKLWIGRRAADRRIEPNKLDNMVAGGLPVGLTPLENLVKEASEEAGIGSNLARQAVSVGTVQYCLEDSGGLKPSVLFLYDLELPRGFVPRNMDGEISDFTLMSLGDVLDMLMAGFEFKFNVALVLIDFMIRHGYITAENNHEYLFLCSRLRSFLP